MGVKLNTNYLKVTNTVSYEQISQEKLENFNISDFIDISKERKALEGLEGRKESAVLESRAAAIAFSRCNREAVFEKMRDNIRNVLV
jgi:hypothetical protein